VFGEDRELPRIRVVPFLLAALATGVLCLLSLGLGNWAYSQRRLSLHRERLDRALAQKPTAAILAQALLAEPGVREIPASDLARRLTVTQRDALQASLRSAAAVRVFSVDRDLVYVLFVGSEGDVQGAAVIDPPSSIGP
jgi:hypothetical protein